MPTLLLQLPIMVLVMPPLLRLCWQNYKRVRLLVKANEGEKIKMVATQSRMLFARISDLSLDTTS